MSAVNKPFLALAVTLLFTILPSTAAGQEAIITPLGNKDILLMVDRKLEPEAIVSIIRSSPCTFDTFPPLLKEMKRRGVPDEVLQAMLDAPYGPSVQSSSRDDLGEEPIYHYAEQLKQMGVLAAVAPGRRTPTPRPRRARATRPRRGY